MNTNNSNLTGQQSFEIITKMIETAKGNMQRSSFYFLFWGWLVLFCSLGQYFLLNFTDYKYPYIVWLLVIPGMIVSFVYSFVKERKVKVRTHYDTIYVTLWMTFLLSYVIILLLMSKINYVIAPLILLLAGNATFLSGLILKFKPLMFGGIIFWIVTVLSIYLDHKISDLLVAVSVLLGYIIPGYMLRSSQKKNNV
jgi:hypothetical protein